MSDEQRKEKARLQKSFRDSQRAKGFKSRQYWVPEGGVAEVDALVIKLAGSHREALALGLGDYVPSEEVEEEYDDLI